MEVYAIQFTGHMHRDGYWVAGLFTDRAKADRVAKWLNEVMVLNQQLWMLEFIHLRAWQLKSKLKWMLLVWKLTPSHMMRQSANSSLLMQVQLWN